MEQNTAALVDDEDTPLQAAVWMCESLQIAPPPLPDLYVDALQEVRMDRLFATDPALLRLTGLSSVASLLASDGWPRRGVAFGYEARGTNGHWTYTIVSEQILIHLHLRYQALSPAAQRASAALISAAHGRLETYLANETNYIRAISDTPPAEGVPRRVICLVEENGETTEWHAQVADPQDGCHFTARSEIFSDQEGSALETEEMMILRP